MNEPRTVHWVIAVAGPSGAGKTTLVRELVARLGNAAALFFDDYESSSTYPDMEQWLAEGADPNQFRTPHLSMQPPDTIVEVVAQALRERIHTTATITY